MAELVPESGGSGFSFELDGLVVNGQVRIASNETAENVGHDFLLLSEALEL